MLVCQNPAILANDYLEYVCLQMRSWIDQFVRKCVGHWSSTPGVWHLRVRGKSTAVVREGADGREDIH